MAGKFDIDDALVRKLAGLLNETGLTEIEYEAGGRRVRVARGGGGGPGRADAAPPDAAAPPVAPAETPAAETDPPKAAGVPVTAPMVGTVYLAPQPGADPFIKVGDAVTEGQTVALIEAMKTFNPVRAPRAGTVTRVLVGDTDPVEFGEELMIIE